MDGFHLINMLGPWTERPGPLYQRLTRALEQVIRTGELPPATRLPSERWLAQHLNISRGTVVAAYGLLEEAAWVERRLGSGTQVCSLSPQRSQALRQEALAHVGHGPVIDTYLSAQSESIDLSTGAPAWPSELEADLCQLSPRDVDTCLAEYGYAPYGLPALRQAIAAWHTRAGLRTEAEQILVTSGAQQAISLLAMLLLRTGDSVLLQNPSFFGAIDSFRAVGARLLPVSVQTDRIALDELDRHMAAGQARCLYLIPTFHNPTGHTLTETERRQIVHMGQASGIPIIEDLTMANNVIDRDPPPPLAMYAREGDVFTIGSLSKLFWAGLRVGWIRASTAQVERLSRLKAIGDLGSSIMSQVIAVRLMPHMERVREMRRRELGERRDLLVETLRLHAPEWRWDVPGGGLFLWPRVPDVDARDLAQATLRAGVKITPGTVLSIDSSHTDRLRIPYLLPSPHLQAGVLRLISVWREMSYAGRHVGSTPVGSEAR